MSPDQKQDVLVATLAKSGQLILESLDAAKCHQLHMLVGMMSELGELADAFKRHIFYSRPLDRENVVEELGDFLFYENGLRQSLMIERSEVIEYNFNKLNKRYSEKKYSDEQANARADKASAT